MPEAAHFSTLRDALEYTVQRLIPERHSYIINIFHRNSCVMQIVDQEHVFGDGNLGLTVSLAFDADSGEAENYRRFLASPLKALFVPRFRSNIPCFVAPCGIDVEAAEKLTYQVLMTVYFNADSLDLQYEVSDEGFVEDGSS